MVVAAEDDWAVVLAEAVDVVAADVEEAAVPVLLTVLLVSPQFQPC